MSKRTNQPKRDQKLAPDGAPTKRAVFIVMLIALLGFGAFAAYVGFTPGARHVAQSDRREPDDNATPGNSGPPSIQVQDSNPTSSNKSKLSVKIPAIVQDDVVLGSEKTVPDSVDPAVFLANEIIANLGVTGARALGDDVQNRIAYIDFDSSLEDGMGSDQESKFIKSLQAGLGQLPEIDKFQIRINGQPIESLGHIELTDPIDVIRPVDLKTQVTPEFKPGFKPGVAPEASPVGSSKLGVP